MTMGKDEVQRPSWLDLNEYPFAAHCFSMPEGDMHYLDEGQGETVVMVHGTPEWTFVYRHLVKALRPTYRCVAADNLGFGLSDKPAHTSYAPEKQFERLELFLNHLGLAKFTLVVHDFGGPIGLAYAQKYPDKVKRLVLMNTWLWGVKTDPFYAYFSRLMHTALGRWLYLRLSFSARFIMKGAVADKRKLSPEIHRHYLEPFPTPESRLSTLTYAQSFINSDAWFETLWHNRKRIEHLPALIIWGMKDPAFGEKALLRLRSVFAHCETHRLEGTGHFPQEESPKQVLPLIEAFLRTPS